MGREIRRVPAHWQHPKRTKFNYLKMQDEESFQPLYNESYISAVSEWIHNHLLWERGEHPDQQGKDRSEHRHYAQWGGGPPDVEYYRPEWKPEEMMWYQVYETVSEGTPVTPPFETQAELIEYLVKHGDFWDQKRREEGTALMACEPWTRRQAESFVLGSGWAPSLVMHDGKIQSGVAAMAELSEANSVPSP